MPPKSSFIAHESKFTSILILEKNHVLGGYQPMLGNQLQFILENERAYKPEYEIVMFWYIDIQNLT